MKSISDILNPEFNDILEDTKFPRDERPALTRKRAEFMLGEPIKNVVIYDCRTQKFNRHMYNGCFLMGRKSIGRLMPEFTQLISQGGGADGRIPLAIVAKTCDWYGESYHDYNHRGYDIAGNVIFYNPNERRYTVFSYSWMYCGSRSCVASASEEAVLIAVRGMLERRDWLKLNSRPRTK